MSTFAGAMVVKCPFRELCASLKETPGGGMASTLNFRSDRQDIVSLFWRGVCTVVFQLHQVYRDPM